MDFDASQLPNRIMTALMLRGSQLPPLQWSEHPNKTALNLLAEAVTNPELFGAEPLLDDRMASAVRALLYLWNGWLNEARSSLDNAPELERAYIEGLVERQAGDITASKTCFQTIEAHPVYDELAQYAPAVIGDSRTAIVKRMREVIAFVEQWEPYVFTDVYELAVEGKLDENDEKIVREIQCREYELLFKHCYQAATGRTLKARPAEVAKPIPKKPKRPTHVQHQPPPSKKPPADMKKLGDKARKPLVGVFVSCPHCQTQNRLTEEQRGTVASCCKCRAAFKVPLRTGLTSGKK